MKRHQKWFVSGALLTVAAFTLTAWTTSKSSDTATQTSADDAKVGVISMEYCLENSKFGKTEKAKFDELENQIKNSLQQKEKELNEMAAKFNDEYLDTLTPEAEAELKQKFRMQSQQFSQEQNEYIQSLQQLKQQIMQKLYDMITEASKKIAKEKGLKFTLNEDACFFYQDSFDISQDIVKEMDSMYEIEKKMQTAADKKSDQKK